MRAGRSEGTNLVVRFSHNDNWLTIDLNKFGWSIRRQIRGRKFSFRIFATKILEGNKLSNDIEYRRRKGGKRPARHCGKRTREGEISRKPGAEATRGSEGSGARDRQSRADRQGRRGAGASGR